MPVGFLHFSYLLYGKRWKVDIMEKNWQTELDGLLAVAITGGESNDDGVGHNKRHGSITKKGNEQYFFLPSAQHVCDTHRQLLENCLVIFMRGKRNNVADSISLPLRIIHSSTRLAAYTGRCT